MMLSLLLPLLLAKQPAPVLAYLTPEEVMLQEQMQNFNGYTSYAPPNTRQARALGQQTTLDREAQHPSLLSDPTNPATEQASSAAVSPDAAAGDDPSVHTVAPAAASIPLDPTTLRLLQRIEQNNIRDANTNTVIGSQAQPLTPSGLESTATLIVMLLAIAWTIWRARSSRGWRFR